MIEGLGWLTLIIVGIAAVIVAFVRPRSQSPANTPVVPPDPEATQVGRGIIADAARVKIDGIAADLAGDDPAGAIADASNRARSDR